MTLKPTLEKTSDEEIVDCYRNSHDITYVGELYLRYVHLVYGTCLKYLKNEENAKEAAMQIFEILVREMKKHSVTNFKPWLYDIVKNFCAAELRKKPVVAVFQPKMEIMEDVSAGVEPADEIFQTKAEDDSKTLNQILIKNLHTLNNEQRKCLQLFYIENMSYKAIEDKTGYTEREIKNYIQNGKRNLKQRMKNNGSN